VEQGGRGGDRVVDSFQVGNDDMISGLLLQREVAMRRGGLSLCLVGPITVSWESSRSDPQISRLRVTGHVATLQCTPKKGPVWTLPTFTVVAEDAPQHERDAAQQWAHGHQIAMAKGLRRMPSIRKILREFLDSAAGRLLS
jgi:hypothetical protein